MTDWAEEDRALYEFLTQPEMGYLKVRRLDDGTFIALGELLYTRAIYVDCDRWGFGKRFCFEDRGAATVQFLMMQTGDDEPVGYIARR